MEVTPNSSRAGCPLLGRLFHGGFAAVMALLLAVCAAEWQYNTVAALGSAAVLGAALWAAHRLLGPRVDAMPRRWFRLVFWAGAAAYLALLIAVGQALTMVLVSDLGVVYHSVPEFLQYGHPLQSNDYYVACNNNLGLALVLAGFFAVTGITPDDTGGVAAAITFNCGAIFLTVLLLCAAVRLVTHRQSTQLLALCCCAAFAPFYLWAPYFYTDTLCMPYLMGVVVLYLVYRRRPRWWLAVLMSVVGMAGFIVRGSLGVLPVALAIAMVVERRDWRGALVSAAAFLVLLGGWRVFNQYYIDWEREDLVGFPTELWLCYASVGDGNYNQADVDLCRSLPDMESRRIALRQRLVENYTSRTAAETVAFELHKAAVTWGDGEYGAREYLATPLRSNFLLKFTLAGQPGYMPLGYYCQAWQFLLLGLTALGSGLAVRRSDGALMPRVALFGVMLLLSIWETKARYALHFAPVLLLCALLVLDRLAMARGPGRR